MKLNKAVSWHRIVRSLRYWNKDADHSMHRLKRCSLIKVDNIAKLRTEFLNSGGFFQASEFVEILTKLRMEVLGY